jgi:septum formation protein
MLRLVLASASPRRRDLLKEAGYEFMIDPVKVSEIIDENLSPEAAVLDVARQKLEATLSLPKYSKQGNFLVLAADTMVFLDCKPLGKPKNPSQAEQYLVNLSAQTHSVITAVWLFPTDGRPAVSQVVTTLVTFRKLSAEEIRAYVASGDPMDKAGAYGIQGAAKNFVSRVEGSTSNVVGLPMEALESLIKKNGYILDRTKSNPDS